MLDLPETLAETRMALRERVFSAEVLTETFLARIEATHPDWVAEQASKATLEKNAPPQAVDEIVSKTNEPQELLPAVEPQVSRQGEEINGVPRVVLETEARARALGMEVFVEENFGAAGNSADAAGRRNFVGRQGVPNCMEASCHLYSYNEVIDGKPVKRYVMPIIRGSEKIDVSKVERHLTAEMGFEIKLERVDGVADFGHPIHGLVNPFMKELEGHSVRFLWDKFLIEDSSHIFGLFINAGDKHYGLMFWPKDHPSAQDPNNSVDLIVDGLTDPRPEPRKARIAILTAEDETNDILLETIIRRLNLLISNNQQESFDETDPRASLAKQIEPESIRWTNSNLDLSMYQGQVPNKVRDYLLKMVRAICQIPGLEVLAIGNNTLSAFTREVEEICAEHNIRHVSMPAALAERLKRRNPKSIVVCGTDYIVNPETSPYGPIMQAFGKDNIALTKEQMSEFRALANRGKVRKKTINAAESFASTGIRILRGITGNEVFGRKHKKLKKIMRNTAKARAGLPLFIPALTEISIGLDAKRKSDAKRKDPNDTTPLLFNVLDPVIVYGEKLADICYELAFEPAPKIAIGPAISKAAPPSPA